MKRRLVITAVMGMMASMLAGAMPASAAVPNAGFAAAAYGSYATLGAGNIPSGPTALSVISCTKKAGLTRTNTAATTNVPKLGNLGVANTKVITWQTATGRADRADAKTTGLNILDGQITADALSAAATAYVTDKGVFGGTHSVSLLNLKIAGKAIPANPPANTVVPLPFGAVALNVQAKKAVTGGIQVGTTAMIVNITGSNPMGLPIGSRVVVSHTSANLDSATGYVGGFGYTSQANLLDGKVVSGPTALAYVKCAGGKNTANIASATVPGVVSTGTTTTTTNAEVKSTSRYAQVVNHTAAPNVLNGAITAQAIMAATVTGKTGSNPIQTVDQSKFVGLQVKGAPAINDSVKPNTVVNIPNLGKVTFRKTEKLSYGLTVTMIHIVISQPIGALPTGSVIEISKSRTFLM